MTSTDFPRYFVYGERPVKMVRTADGGLDVLAYEWETGEFVRDLDYYTDIYYSTDDDARRVSEDEFNRYVAELRERPGGPAPGPAS